MKQRRSWDGTWTQLHFSSVGQGCIDMLLLACIALARTATVGPLALRGTLSISLSLLCGVLVKVSNIFYFFFNFHVIELWVLESNILNSYLSFILPCNQIANDDSMHGFMTSRGESDFNALYFISNWSYRGKSVSCIFSMYISLSFVICRLLRGSFGLASAPTI